MYSERSEYHFQEYGSILQIRRYEFSRDGRAIINAIGTRRFRVLKTTTKDGYNVAEVEWIKDTQVVGEKEIQSKQETRIASITRRLHC